MVGFGLRWGGGRTEREEEGIGGFRVRSLEVLTEGWFDDGGLDAERFVDMGLDGGRLDSSRRRRLEMMKMKF